MTATGVEKLTCCQPLAVSLVNVAVASCCPPLVHRAGRVRAGVGRALVEPRAGDQAVGVGGELHAQLDGLVVAAVDGRRA